jgi:hypothetical protein
MTRDEKKKKTAFMDRIKHMDSKWVEFYGWAEQYGGSAAYQWMLNNSLVILKRAHKQGALLPHHYETLTELSKETKDETSNS